MIREYRTEDADDVRACFVELQEFERRIDPNLAEGELVAERYLAYMFSRCAETAGRVFVAEEDGRAVGFISVWARVQSKAVEEREYEYAYISDLVVLASHRGRGLGRALLSEAEDYAARQGATIFRLGVLAKNEAARRLYLEYGFEEHVVAMSKSVTRKV